METFGIIGCGKLGSALARELNELNLLMWICSESGKIPYELDVDSFRTIQDINKYPDVIIISKSDSHIHDAASSLAIYAGEELAGKLVIHCSGVHSIDILKSCMDNGAEAAVAHPYQTFFRYTNDVFTDIAWTVEAGNNFKRMEKLINKLGGRAFDISGIPQLSRELYHASAVFASNYMNTITALAAETALLSGINPSDFLPAILRTSLENIISSMMVGTELTLTGPISRADVSTISKQINALKSHPHICLEYCRIGLSTLEVLFSKELIQESKYFELKKIFNENI